MRRRRRRRRRRRKRRRRSWRMKGRKGRMDIPTRRGTISVRKQGMKNAPLI
jgi:hypothetical protein